MISGSVEFRLNIQEIPKRNLVANFVERVRQGLGSKGLRENKEYSVEIEGNEIPTLTENMMLGGAFKNTDSTFPYSVMERFLDYIDNNVRSIKTENIETDEYKKTEDNKRRILDGLFNEAPKAPTQDTTQAPDERKDELPNTWDKLVVEPTAPTTEVKDQTSSIFDYLFTSNKNKTEENIEHQKETQKPTINQDIIVENISTSQDQKSKKDDLRAQETDTVTKSSTQSSQVPIKIEGEYLVKIYINRKYVQSCVERGLGKRELMRIIPSIQS